MALVRTDVSEEHGTFVISVPRIGLLGTALAVTSNCMVNLCFDPEDRQGVFTRNIFKLISGCKAYL
jgi:hypothetical protein